MAEGLSVVLLALLAVCEWAYSAESVRKCVNTPVKQIVCEFGAAKAIADFDACLCTHIAIPVTLESEKDDDQTPDFAPTIKSYKEANGDLKSLAAVSVYAEDVAKKSQRIREEIVDVLGHYDGVQLDLRQSDVAVDKSLVAHFFKELSSEIDSKFRGSSTNNSSEPFKKTKEIQLVLPPNAAILTKFYDLKKLTKFVDFFIIATHNLVDISEQGYTYHPSRLMGTDDLLNADSLVDLVTGLGVDHLSILLSLPSTASKFLLKNSTENTPRAPAIGLPTTISRQQMCEEMKEGNWTIERDEDLTAPYAFMNTTWMSFDDSVSVSIKGKYILLRDLAGAVVTDVEALDWKLTCLNQTEVEPLKELAKTFTETARKSRSAQLLSLQEQLQRPADQGFYFNNEISYSPYYIERVVTRDGEVHVIRKDTKTEFECSRQGYFRHPSGCNRFYRCVKFDEKSNYFTVYEFDCPDGLAFDEKVEVCVWPGSLSNTGACQGSSEIAPVPRNQFVCPPVEGYYADPENCRWFFACLDHARDGGYTPLTAYEFRCPFGLVFDETSLKCDWPWKVGSCGNHGQADVHHNYYGEQQPLHAARPYQPNQLDAYLYGKAPFVPYANYLQDRPPHSFDSVDSYVAPTKFSVPQYSTTEKSQLIAENRGTASNSLGVSYDSAHSFVPPSSGGAPVPEYGLPAADVEYVSTVRPFYGSTGTYSGTNGPTQTSYGFTGTTIKPEFPTESHASKPRLLLYGTNEGHSSSIRPQYSYGSTESSYGSTSKPRISYAAAPYGASESYSAAVKPQFTHDGANTVPPGGRSLDYDAFGRPEALDAIDGPVSGILYHLQRESAGVTPKKYRSGVLLHQQNGFLRAAGVVPVNRNYDSHKNDVQYPPIRDYETTYSATPLSSRLYAENYSPSNTYSGPSIVPSYAAGDARKSPYSVLGAANGYGSHAVNEHYRPPSSSSSYEAYYNNFETTTRKPAVIINSSGVPPTTVAYSRSVFDAKPTSKPFAEYVVETRSSARGEDSPQHSAADSPPYYVSSPPPALSSAVDDRRTSAEKPGYHDTSLYGERFGSTFDFEDYHRSGISAEPYPSTTSAALPTSTHSSAAFRPTVNYYYSPTSPSTVTAHGSPGAYKETASRDYYKLPTSTHSSATFRPTVDYYYSPTSPATAHDDSAFVERLIAELSKSSGGGGGGGGSAIAPADFRPQTAGGRHLADPGHSDADRPATLSSYAENTTPRPQAYTTAYGSFGPVQAYSARLPVTARPAGSLPGYSSTAASDLIGYYHDLHASLDSAYRSPFPGLRNSAAVGAGRHHYSQPGDLTLARGYERDAGDVAHELRPAAYPPKPIVVEPVSPELNAEFERYYTTGVRARLLPDEDTGKVLVVGDTGPRLLVGKLGAQCDCDAASGKKPAATVVSTTTRTVVGRGNDDDDDHGKTAVKEVETRTRVVLLEDAPAKKPPTSGAAKLCTRPGLFRDPKRCNRFYSCNWDKWTHKYQLSDFKCPIHLAFDENLSACNWPSKGPACSHDTLIGYAN